ncbi:MAG TPA: hypothetical protein DDW50_11705 [Firmicutes bacterium]|nr:hypothetical protein [Bacillota bacterium]
MESLEGNQLQGLLEQKIHFLEEMLTCSKMMTDLNFESHEAEYNNLLETRQQCLEALTSIENTLKTQFKVDIDRNLAEDPFLQRISHLNDVAKKLIQEILDLDKQNKAAISEELQHIKIKIQALGRGRKGIAGYEAPRRININGIFTDSRK